jgi:preprotein translocase subunit SecD
VKEYERKQLLDRVDREAATVGADIPDRIDLYAHEADRETEPLDLRAFVFEVRKLDRVPPDRREEAEELKKRLRRERLQRRQLLEAEKAITREEGDRIVEEIVGLDRALNALEQVGQETDLEAEARRQEMADKRRWRSFLNKALGKDDVGGGPGL